MDILQNISVDTIYVMGLSFVLGSFFTILLLIFLDFIRRHKESNFK